MSGPRNRSATSGLGFAHAVFARDVRLAFRSGGGWFHALFFFAVFIVLSALAIGPDRAALAAAAPAVAWLALAFALQFAATGAFDQDLQDGALRAMAAEQPSLMPYWLAKAGVLFTLSAAPIIAAAPFALTMLGVPFADGLKAAALLAVGAPALALVALLTAALAAGLRAGGLLAAVIAAPFAAPALVFGVGAAKILLQNGDFASPETLILGALSLFMAAATPGFAVAALRLSLE